MACVGSGNRRDAVHRMVRPAEIMMRDVFLNCTQHNLTNEQREAALGLPTDIGIEVRELRSIAPELFAQLSDLGEEADICKLALELDFILRGVEACETPEGMDEPEEEGRPFRKLYVHLPIGSPAFMFAFARHYTEPSEGDEPRTRFVFSHTRRDSVEIADVESGLTEKRTIFRFIKYIIL